MKEKNRIENELKHAKFLLQNGAGQIWGWETPAGKIRWKRRVKMLTDHITKKMEVLEVGCGTGYFTKSIAGTGAKITAIDISPDLIQSAKKAVKSPRVTFLIENAYKMKFKKESFDSIVGSSVLHHLELDDALREFYRVLRKGGTLFFTEPNMMNPQIALQKNIPYLKRKMGDSPDETAFFKWRLRKKLKEHGFQNISIIPFDFLHPQIPESFIKYFKPVADILEHTPIFKEIAGSLYIIANK